MRAWKISPGDRNVEVLRENFSPASCFSIEYAQDSDTCNDRHDGQGDNRDNCDSTLPPGSGRPAVRRWRKCIVPFAVLPVYARGDDAGSIHRFGTGPRASAPRVDFINKLLGIWRSTRRTRLPRFWPVYGSRPKELILSGNCARLSAMAASAAMFASHYEVHT